MKSENVISSMKPRVLVSFYENKVVVNRKLAPEHTQATILGFLEAHNVTPCPIRIIEITPEYIADGDITSDGFHGRINGRANIKDIESSLKEPIIPLESSSSLQPQVNEARQDFRFDAERDWELVAGEAAFGMAQDGRLRRYWRQRYRLFTRFDHGVLMDREGWFSVRVFLMSYL